jgi:hypothetical protein
MLCETSRFPPLFVNGPREATSSGRETRRGPSQCTPAGAYGQRAPRRPNRQSPARGSTRGATAPADTTSDGPPATVVGAPWATPLARGVGRNRTARQQRLRRRAARPPRRCRNGRQAGVASVQVDCRRVFCSGPTVRSSARRHLNSLSSTTTNRYAAAPAAGGQTCRPCLVPTRTGFPRSRGRSPTLRQGARPLRRWR